LEDSDKIVVTSAESSALPEETPSAEEEKPSETDEQ